jgi:hypothetical protein
MTTLKTLIASAIVAVSATAAFADGGNFQDKQDIYAVFAQPGLTEGRNAASTEVATPRSDSWAGIQEHILTDRPALVEGRNSAVAPVGSAPAPEGSNR